MPQEVASACWAKGKPEARGTLRATVRARARRGRRGGTLLLLTLLGVRAYPAPRTARPRSPPLQQKRSQGRNCSSTSLQRQTRPKTGGQQSKASSPSPTTTRRSSRQPRGHGKSRRRRPTATRPPGVQLRCTPRRGSRRRLPAGLTSTTTPRRRRIRGLVGTSARSWTIGDKKTLGRRSSAAEKPGDNQISELGPLSIRTRPVSQATCRTRQVVLRSPASCGVSSGPA